MINISQSRPSVAQTTLTSGGFTIVELLIATLVFSMVLIIITTGVIQFSKGYYHGVNSSSTQTTAQNALDTISQAIQFSASGTTEADSDSQPEGVFCAGGKLFRYTVGVKNDGSTPAAIGTGWGWGLDEFDYSGATCDPSTIPSGDSGTELIGKNMRLTYISLSNVQGGMYDIQLGVAFGDSDLLCSHAFDGDSANPGGCQADDTPYATNATVPGANLSDGTDVQCKTGVGDQFCSVSLLSTNVMARLGN